MRHWSTDSYPEAGNHPQKVLNKQLVSYCDAVIAVYWTRFGTPTDEYGSGTEEEIDELIKNNKQIFLYFSDCEINPSKIDNEQYQKVKAFRDKYIGYYGTYSSLDEFKKQLLRHLYDYFAKVLGQNNSNNSSILATSIPDSRILRYSTYSWDHEGGLLRARDRYADSISITQPFFLVTKYFNNILMQYANVSLPVNVWTDIVLSQLKDHTKDNPVWYSIEKFDKEVATYERSALELVESIENTTIKKTGMNRAYNGYVIPGPPSLLTRFTVGLFEYVLQIFDGYAPVAWQCIIAQNTTHHDVYMLHTGVVSQAIDAAYGTEESMNIAKKVQFELLEEMLYSKELQLIHEEYKRLEKRKEEIKTNLKKIDVQQIKKGRCRWCSS